MEHRILCKSDLTLVVHKYFSFFQVGQASRTLNIYPAKKYISLTLPVVFQLHTFHIHMVNLVLSMNLFTLTGRGMPLFINLVLKHFSFMLVVTHFKTSLSCSTKRNRPWFVGENFCILETCICDNVFSTTRSTLEHSKTLK